MQKKKILKYKNKKEAYYGTNIVEEKEVKQEKINYYEESINALIKYMTMNEQNPNEKIWDQYAVCMNYLSSKTIGYLSGIGFNTLCRKLRKQINKEKRQINN